MNNNKLNLLYLDLPLLYDPKYCVITDCYRNIFRERIEVNTYIIDDIYMHNVEIKDIDIIFCSDFGYTHYDEAFDNILKVYFSIENCIPNINYVDYSISTYKDNMMGRNYTMPTIVHYMPLYLNMDESIKQELNKYNENELFNRKFASYVVSNGTFCDPKRIELFNVINTYDKIYSPGKIHNNCEFSDIIGLIDTSKNFLSEKRLFIKHFKFNLAFENSISPGYLTEKIGDAFYNITIPIYYGDSISHEMFNDNSFIDISNMNNDDILHTIKEFNEDKTKYLDMLYANKINVNSINYLKGLYDFLFYILEHGKKQMVKYGTHKRFQKEMYKLWDKYGDEVKTC